MICKEYGLQPVICNILFTGALLTGFSVEPDSALAFSFSFLQPFYVKTDVWTNSDKADMVYLSLQQFTHMSTNVNKFQRI